MKPVRVGMFYFSQKGQAIAWMRDILNGLPVGTRLEGLDHYFVTKAFRMHRGDLPVSHHVIGMNYGDGYRGGSRGFHTYLADGAMQTWACLAPFSPHTPWQQMLTAARNSWLPHARKRKDARFAGDRYCRCDRCGGPMAWADAEWHHEPPWTFLQIAEAWAGEPRALAKRNGLLVLADDAAFVAFHDQRASISLIHKACHHAERRWRRGQAPFRTVRRLAGGPI